MLFIVLPKYNYVTIEQGMVSWKMYEGFCMKEVLREVCKFGGG